MLLEVIHLDYSSKELSKHKAIETAYLNKEVNLFYNQFKA